MIRKEVAGQHVASLESCGISSGPLHLPTKHETRRQIYSLRRIYAPETERMKITKNLHQKKKKDTTFHDNELASERGSASLHAWRQRLLHGNLIIERSRHTSQAAHLSQEMLKLKGQEQNGKGIAAGNASILHARSHHHKKPMHAICAMLVQCRSPSTFSPLASCIYLCPHPSVQQSSATRNST